MSKPYRILIVDDSAMTRAMIKRIIGLSGLPVAALYEACDGQAALAVLETVNVSDPVDLVLTDLNMPVMDGVELVRRMQANDALRSLPVIVVSAQPDQQMVDELKRLGTRGYLRKPFTPESVRSAVENILASPAGPGGQND